MLNFYSSFGINLLEKSSDPGESHLLSTIYWVLRIFDQCSKPAKARTLDEEILCFFHLCWNALMFYKNCCAMCETTAFENLWLWLNKWRNRQNFMAQIWRRIQSTCFISIDQSVSTSINNFPYLSLLIDKRLCFVL